jgi:rhomboid protease GluP
MLRVLRTMLSYPPRKSASIVAAFSVLVLALGASMSWSNFHNAEQWMSASRDLVFDKREYWRLFTTLFVHADAGHLVSNSALYAILSFLLYGYFGVFVFPVASWLLAIPMTAFALKTYPGDTQLIGASGLVHLMGGIWLSLYLLIATNKSLRQRTLRSVGVMLGIFFPTSFEAKTSYRVHFIGLAIGLSAGALYHLVNRKQLHAHEVKYRDPEDEESPIEFNNLEELEELDPP